jgi:2-polyprenyl-3-methyl-5-hydroxy-6-metoxy-1,4-benzoquinol methylase
MQIYSDDEIINLLEEYMQGSQNPDFKGYREQTYQRDFANKERFLWSLKHIAELGQYRNKCILDVGCGCGWQAFTMSLLDRENKIVAVDILPSMIEGTSECVASMRKKGVAFNLTPMCGDICNLELEPSSFDAIYSIEAIEHVRDMKQMLDRCFTLLKPNGTLILVNDSNMLNRRVRNEHISMWQERENSWKWSEYLRSIRPIEHRDARPFAVMREEIVRAANPNLEPRVVQKIVDATAGLLRSEIETIATNFKNGTHLPSRPDYDWCRNPITGEYAERLFDPFALARCMQRAGFRAKVRHFFRKFPLNLANQIQFWPLNYLLFNLRSAFIVCGEKVEQAGFGALPSTGSLQVKLEGLPRGKTSRANFQSNCSF